MHKCSTCVNVITFQHCVAGLVSANRDPHFNGKKPLNIGEEKLSNINDIFSLPLHKVDNERCGKKLGLRKGFH